VMVMVMVMVMDMVVLQYPQELVGGTRND